MRKIILFAMCALALVACKKEVPEMEVMYSITGDCTNVTENSVTITCSSVTDDYFDIIERGLVYSTNSDVPNHDGTWRSVEGGFDKEEYTVAIEGLQSGTTYYYRSYVYIRYEFNIKRYFFGEVKSFTTLPAV